MKLFISILLLITSLYSYDKDISLQLCWKNQFQFAGFYIAKEKGYYSDVDLNVTIKEYSNIVNVVDEVVSTKSTYGIGKSSLLIDKNNGKAVVALSAIYQSSPSILITTDKSIKSPSDLKDKKIMITSDEAQSASVMTMLLSNGILKEDLTIQNHSFNYKDLITKKTDAMACYLSNEPYSLDLESVKYTVFNPKDYSYDFYGDILFTSSQELKDNPKRVKAFRSASDKGWLWAFNNIEETAKIIHEKYNTQNKSLDSLVYEGYVLKQLAVVDGVPFGHISVKKFKAIANIYKMSGLLNHDYTLDGFFNTLEMNKFRVKIGILAKRGKEITEYRWKPMVDYLNENIDTHYFEIVDLNFDELEQSVKNKELDFVITNTAYYVILEKRYGVSRIATLLNSDAQKKHITREFGSVIFVKSDNNSINTVKDLNNNSFGAVDELSFGGWIMAYEELLLNNIDKDDLDIKFFGTHDAVVKAVLSGEISAGTVRTDTLERMALEGKIDLSKIKVLDAKEYQGFPYLVTTKLYPEWPIAKLNHASDLLANKVLSELILYNPKKEDIRIQHVAGWTVPLDYSSIHRVLKKLRIPPYRSIDINLSEIASKYSLYIYGFVIFFILLIFKFMYQWRVNIYLSRYNKTLNEEVELKTHKLIQANEKLKKLAQTDSLTGINSRGYFMKFAKKYFDIAKRNNKSIQVLSLDLDYFKNVNDTYGHSTGDTVLKEFAKTITSLLRESDIFGRIGGEEFCVVLQNTTMEGAITFANRLCKAINNLVIESDENKLKITVSIGVSELSNEKTLEELINKSDIALYKAKENGRNRVESYSGE